MYNIANKPSLGAVAAILALAAPGCTTESVPAARAACDTAKDCAQGQLCVASVCSPCQNTEACLDAAEYDAGSMCEDGQCVPASGCQIGDEGCACSDEGACAWQLACIDSTCAPPCQVDYIHDGDGCRPAVGCEVCDSRGLVCAADSGSNGQPECGDCKPGHRMLDDSPYCELVPTCELGAAGSIANICSAQMRVCLPGDNGAQCGPCVASTVSVGDECQPLKTCDDLACEDANRTCESEPNGHCAGCQDGFIDRDGTCSPVLTCASEPCAVDTFCTDATAHTDRTCVEAVGGCPAWNVPHRDGVSCVQCPVPCTQVVGSSGAMAPTAFAGTQCVCETADGYFLSPGEDGRAASIVACDADGDGWVRDTILGLLKYRRSNADAAELLLDNNRCTIQMAERMHMRSESGESVALETPDTPIPLLESSRNDDDSELLALVPTDADFLPPMGGGAPLQASEINSLTKACISTRSDVNHNGVPDIKESQRNEDAAYIALLSEESPVGPLLKDYTYYLEIYAGWFEPSAEALIPGWVAEGESLGGHTRLGNYVIQERSRTATPAESVDSHEPIRLSYYGDPSDETATPEDNTGGNDHWRSCIRFQDADYDTRRLDSAPLQGLDFGRFAASAPLTDTITREQLPAAFGHHSQFKCMLVDDALSSASSDGYVYSSSTAATYTFNQCGNAQGGQEATDSDEASLACARVDTVEQGWVGWGLANYDATADYKRGCANEFAFFRAGCPGFTEDTAHLITGAGDTANYGNLLCGCASNYGGTLCDFGCPNSSGVDGIDHLFLHPDYARLGAEALYPSVTRPYWLCGETSAMHTAGTPVLSNAAGYTLFGTIPTTPAVTAGPVQAPSLTTETNRGQYSISGGFLLQRPTTDNH